MIGVWLNQRRHIIHLFLHVVVLATPTVCTYSINSVIEEVAVLTDEDFANAEMLTKDEIYRDPIPLDEINRHRPDIRIPFEKRRRHKRNGVSRTAKIWSHGRIPYAISPHYSTHERALLARAVKQYHDKTCVRFVPRAPGEGDYLFIGKVDGCFSEVGRTSGVQVLSLDNGCMEYPTIIHEMMHVVGFYHEHERWDRDNYIDIIWQNIDRGALDQFGKVDLSKTSYYGQPYDYKSILHYDSLAFSKNGFPTMLPKKPVEGYAATIGNAKDFSEVDLAKINRMYKCDQRGYYVPPSGPKARSVPIYNPSSNKAYDQAPSIFSQSIYEDKVYIPECEDRITVCWWTQDRCNSPSIHMMMKALCAKTCKFC